MSIINFHQRNTPSGIAQLRRMFPSAKALTKFYFIFFSFVIAFLFTILPLPEWARWCWPAWVALVLVFWQVTNPESVGLLTAWFSGLILDVLYNTILGEHAIALLFVVTLVRCIHHKIKIYNMALQMLILFPIFLMYQTTILLIQGMLGEMNHAPFFCLPAISTTLLWPWLSFLLMDTAKGFVREL